MIARLLACLILILAAAPVKAADTQEKKHGHPPLDPSDAFAVNDGRGGHGRVYPAFYDYHVSPHAVVAKGRVFTTYQDSRGRPLVMAYDIDEQQWSGPVRASKHGLGGDAHGNPSLCIDGEGRLHLFFGCHGHAMRHVRSTEPYAIDEWEKAPSPAARATYPQSMRMADGRMFLFYRAGGHTAPWVLRISGDEGASWSDPERIIEMRRNPKDRRAAAYCQFSPGADGRTVHAYFVHKDDNANRDSPHPWRPLRFPGLGEAVYRYNIYYIHRDAEGVWRSGRGEKLDPPLSRAAADAEAMLYDSGSEFARIKQFTVDENNRPYLRFQVGVVDWTQADPDVLVPPRKMYAAQGEEGWRVSYGRAPSNWPEAVKRRIEQTGPTAYPVPSEWYLRDVRERLRPGKGASVFLKHLTDGYATREGGPAEAP